MNYCPSCATKLKETIIEGNEKLACPAANCEFVFWENPTPVVAMLVETPQGVVFARNVAWPRHFYSIITGFLEKAEDPKDCAIRETKEELGLVAQSCELIGVYPFEMQNQVIIGYHIVADGEITLNEELDDFKYMQAEGIKPWDMGTGLVISDWLNSRKN